MPGPDRGELHDLLGTQNRTPAGSPMPAAEPAPPSPPAPVLEPVVQTRAPRRRRPGERWEDRNVRRTFHLPVDLVAVFEALTEELDVSQSAAVREALQRWIAEQRAGGES